jgi:hypothetical protein
MWATFRPSRGPWRAPASWIRGSLPTRYRRVAGRAHTCRVLIHRANHFNGGEMFTHKRIFVAVAAFAATYLPAASAFALEVSRQGTNHNEVLLVDA